MYTAMMIWISFFLMKPLAGAETLRVGVYHSFLSSYGPAAGLKASFQKQCSYLCNVEFVALGHGAQLLPRAVKNPDIDVIMGLDGLSYREYFSKKTSKTVEQVLAPIAIDSKASMVKKPVRSNFLLPYSLTVMGVMERVAKLYQTKAVDSRSFLNLLSEVKRNFFIQDPRTSNLGAGLLYWIARLSANESELKINFSSLKRAKLGVGTSWSNTYGLFLKGEADYVFSYLTSEAYHLAFEGESNYRFVSFKDALPASLENAAILKQSSKKNIARSFIDFLEKADVQTYIALKNVSLPVANTLTKKENGSYKVIRADQKICAFSQVPYFAQNGKTMKLCKSYYQALPIPKEGMDVFFYPRDSIPFKDLLAAWVKGLR